MDTVRRFMIISILTVWSLQEHLADPILSGLDAQNFQVNINAKLNQCNLKIKVIDPKYIPFEEPETSTEPAPIDSTTSYYMSTSDVPETLEEKGKTGGRGLEGPPGTKHHVASKGEPGVKGEQGVKGDRGEKGEPGNTGLQGPPGSNGAPGIRGEKGERGEPGLKGEEGVKGEKGDNGIPGSYGVQGKQGPKGDKGEMGLGGEKGIAGDRGERGIQGEQGSKGDQGSVGAPGMMGLRGVKGERGDKGDRGEHGLKGDKGDVGPAGKSCTCDDLPGPEMGTASLGDSSKPAKSCAELRREGTYHINPSDPFAINCYKEEMCVRKRGYDFDLDEEAKSFDKKPFWWNLDFRNMYKVTESQMAYLLTQSTGVRQTLRYHCYNTEVIPTTDPSKSLLLSLWNGQIVEKEPTRKTPIAYEIQDNSCDKAKDSWEYADIKMKFNFTNRLPIVDIYIQDIRGEAQKAALELIELCFTFAKPL